MRSPLAASAAAHLGVLLVLFLARGPAPLIVPGPDVVQVALVEPTMTQAISAPPPAPAPRVEPAELRAEPGEGVKLTPKKQPVPKVETPRKLETTPSPTAPALPYAPAGNVGLKGQVSVDAQDFAFTYYLMLVRNRIAQNWSPPAGLTSASPVEAVVAFRIERDGAVAALRLESASAMEFFDRSALRAVMLSDPLPPLPLGFGGASLGVHFGFQYASP